MTDFRLTPMQQTPQVANKPPLQVFALDSHDVVRSHDLPTLPTLKATPGSGRAEKSEDTGDSEDRQQLDTGDSIRQKIQTSRGPIWLEGNALLCGCPDCGATMSIRLLISAADCWRCGTSILLNAEQQAAADRLLAERSRANSFATNGSINRAIEPPAEDRTASRPLRREIAEPQTSPVPSRRRASSRPNSRSPARSEVLLEKIFRITPAWLISFVTHFLAILLLALLWVPFDEDSEQITLSTLVREIDEIGTEIKAVDLDNPEYDLPTPPKVDVSDKNVRASLAKADQEARQLRLDESPLAEPANLATVRKRVATSSGSNYKFAARDPRLRIDVLKKEGGTLLTEAAVARGLRWLADHQNTDGSWSLRSWAQSSRKGNRGDAAATSLALLPFLGAGQTHEYGLYKDTVARGLKWLLDHQKENGDLRDGLSAQQAMYAQGQGAIVLVEAFAVSGDERFRIPAQRSIDFICNAQHQAGGWRYNPGQDGDTSVLGWQLMALQSASDPSLGLNVPEDALNLADYFLDTVASGNGSRYQYRPSEGNPTEVMTAEALLCRMYLGWKHDDPRLRSGLNWLVEEHMPVKNKKNIYYWYYATQSLHHFGGPNWDIWNAAMREILVDLQEEEGPHAGSWSENGFRWREGGRVYVTSLAICTLEVYYRHLPLFKQLDIGETENRE